MKRLFRRIALCGAKLATIEKCNAIIDEFPDDRLTLRQLYYQLVGRGLIENTKQSYRNVACTVSDGRLAGLIDWDAIEDRERVPMMPSSWSSIDEIVEAALDGFRLDRWRGQEFYVEVWVEKKALLGVLSPVAREEHVLFLPGKGYGSQTVLYEAAQRFRDANDAGRHCTLLYLGDHDPSGEDMVRDIRDRLELFDAGEVEVEKVALTMAQIHQYRPPPNPAKLTDSRAKGYIAKYGNKSWELDALRPDVLRQMVRTALASYIDRPLMNKVLAEEKRQVKRIRSVLRTEE